MARELYFTHNGKRYECGSIIILKDDYLGATRERVFLCHIPGSDSYLYQNKNGGVIYSINEKDFNNDLVEVKDEICIPIRDSFLQSTSGYNRAPTVIEELMDDNLLIVWIWYIFIVIVSIIFKGRIAIWALASFIFFRYRKRKLRERGFKI